MEGLIPSSRIHTQHSPCCAVGFRDVECGGTDQYRKSSLCKVTDNTQRSSPERSPSTYHHYQPRSVTTTAATCLEPTTGYRDLQSELDSMLSIAKVDLEKKRGLDITYERACEGLDTSVHWHAVEQRGCVAISNGSAQN